MELSAKERGQLVHIAIELERRCRRSGESVSFAGFGYDDLLLALDHLYFKDRDMAESDRRALCSKAVSAAARTGRIDGDSLGQHLEVACGTYQRSPLTRYVLATSVSLVAGRVARRIRIRDGRLQIVASLPKQFTRDAFDREFESLPASTVPGFANVLVHVKARSPFEAYEQATRRLDLIRGCWNWLLNRDIWDEFTPDQARPFNRIVLGPVHTLHDPNGELAFDQFWYEPFFARDAKPARLNAAEHVRMSTWRTELKRYSRCPFRSKVDDLFVRYARALDHGNQEIAFIELWALLEKLTVAEHMNYDRAIKRALWLYADTAIHRLSLEALRRLRNSAVHSAVRSDSRREHVVALHRHVARLIMFWVWHAKDFESAAELGEFLELPSDQHRLQRGMKMYRKAIKFRSPPRS